MDTQSNMNQNVIIAFLTKIVLQEVCFFLLLFFKLTLIALTLVIPEIKAFT